MRLMLLNKDFKEIEELSFAEEIVSIKRYNDVGECKVKIGCDQEVVDLIKDATYIVDYDHPDTYEVNGVTYETFALYEISEVNISTTVNQGDYLNVVARDCLAMLDDRVIMNLVTYVDNHPISLLLSLFNDCYALNNENDPRNPKLIVLDEDSFVSVKNAHKQDTYINDVNAEHNVVDLLTRVLEICQAYKYGIKIRYCPDLASGKFIVSCYTGNELDVEFSPNFSNISDTEYTENRAGYKNWAYVTGTSGKKDYFATDDTTPSVIVWINEDGTIGIDNEYGVPSGKSRYETIIDAASSCVRELTLEELNNFVAPSEGLVLTVGDKKLYIANNEYVAEMDSDGLKGKLYENYYKPLLQNYGIETLKSLQTETSFSGELEVDNVYIYKEDYDLGDIVVAKNIYNLGGISRIIEIWESRDTTGVDILEPKFEW